MTALMVDIKFRMIAVIRARKFIQPWTIFLTHDFHRYIRQYIHKQCPLGNGKRAPKSERLGFLESLGLK